MSKIEEAIVSYAALEDQLLAAKAEYVSSLQDAEAKAEVITAQAAEIARLQAIIDGQNPPPPPPPPPPGEINFFVGPAARGNGSGSSEENAATLASIPSALAAFPSRQVGLLSGIYSPTDPIQLRAGGTPDKPARIFNLGEAIIQGNRGNGGLTTFEMPTLQSFHAALITNSLHLGAGGWDLFQLLQGANHIEFAGLGIAKFKRAFNLIGNVEGITIRRLNSFFCEDHVYQKYGSGNGCKNLQVLNSQLLGYSKSGVRFNGESDGLYIGDTFIDSGYQVGGKFAMGVFINDSAHNVICRRVISRRNLDVNSFNNSGYWNADGFVANRGTYNILFEDCVAEWNSDGGFDVKADNIIMRRCVVRHSKFGFRMHNSATIDNCEAHDIHKASFVRNGTTLTGGTGSSGQVQCVGGQTAADHNVFTIKDSPQLTHVIKQPHQNAGSSFHGEVVRQ